MQNNTHINYTNTDEKQKYIQASSGQGRLRQSAVEVSKRVPINWLQKNIEKNNYTIRESDL